MFLRHHGREYLLCTEFKMKYNTMSTMGYHTRTRAVQYHMLLQFLHMSRCRKNLIIYPLISSLTNV